MTEKEKQPIEMEQNGRAVPSATGDDEKTVPLIDGTAVPPSGDTGQDEKTVPLIDGTAEPPSDTGEDANTAAQTDKQDLSNILLHPEIQDCGILCLKTRTLQKCAKMKAFVGVVSFYMFTYVMLEMYLMAVITTVERRYGITSSKTGLLLGIKDIFIVLAGIFLSHFAKNTHKPRFLATMGYIGALGGFLSTVPFFISKFYQYDVAMLELNPGELAISRGLCLSGYEIDVGELPPNVTSTIGAIEKCEEDENETWLSQVAYGTFAITAVVVGLAFSAVPALCTTYVDDAASPKNNGLYLGILNAMKPFGPLVAFLLGGLFTNTYENLTDPGFDSSDSRWIGAWWLGYIVCPSLLFISSLLLSCFPRHMPPEDGQSHAKVKSTTSVKGFLKSLNRLVRNLVYMLLLAGSCLTAYDISGMLPFIPKYMEVQFHQTTASADVLTGICGPLMGGIGVFLGGFIVSKFRLNSKKCAAFIFVTNLCFILIMLSSLTVSCPQPEYRQPNFDIDSSLAVNGTCQLACDCPPSQFHPVCGSDLNTYQSPCYAGCSQAFENQTYGQCDCIGDSGIAYTGACVPHCSRFVFYLLICSSSALIGMMATIPVLTIILKYVEEKDRSLAIGVANSIVALASYIPGPIGFGNIIDSSCSIWQETCGTKGACLLYDTDKFRFRFHLAIIGFKAMAGIFYLLVWLVLYRRKEESPQRKSRAVEMAEISDIMAKSESNV